MDTYMFSNKIKVSVPVTPAPDFLPVRIVEVELGQPLPLMSTWDERTQHHYRRALCLVRLHTQLLGTVELQLGESGLDAAEYAQYIWEALHAQINEHLQQDNLPVATRLSTMGLLASSTPCCIEKREQFFTYAPFVSIIVSTRDRPERLRVCLSSLLALHYPSYEVIIVDNAPNTSATGDYIQQTYCDVPQVRYMREERPGLSWARNCGIQAARGEILAFTDDDVVVDPSWLVELVKGFGLANDVACVSGLTLPLEIETPAQFWCEEYYGFSWSNKWFTQNIYDMRENRVHSPMYPFIPGLFGAGANTAFTAAFLHNVGGFDPTLGAGTRAGGEDLAAFLQVVTQGYKLVFEPTALVYHQHRRDYQALRKLVYHYGTGATAYLTKSIFDNPRLLFDLLSKLPFGLFRFIRARSSKGGEKSTSYPKELIKLEIKGMLQGPFAYLLNRYEVRSSRKRFISRMSRITFSKEEES